MIENKIVLGLNSILGVAVIPLQLITTSVGGCLVSITFGLLLTPLSFVWAALFLGPLLGTSWLWDKVVLLRPVADLIGIPLALLGGIFVALTPSMGEMESRVDKLRICWTWPFSLDYMRYRQGKLVEDEKRTLRIEKLLAAVRV